jgi:hypothetical protein
MLDLVLAAAKLQQDLDSIDLPNCIIGGLALQAWGETRMTRDADFTVLTNFSNEANKISAILQFLTPRRPDAFEFALQNRVVLGYVSENVSVDIGLGGFDYEAALVQRAVPFEFAPEVWLRVCSAEDLIVMKVFAGRTRDWADVQSIIDRQASLDWNRIEVDLMPLLELSEAPEGLAALRKMRKN